MKKLRKTLALVLAVVMLISVVPFTVNAEGSDVKFDVATVNGSAYDGTSPIVSGDTITVSVTINRAENEILKAWMLGYSFDSVALTYIGTSFGSEWKGSTSDKTNYVLIGGSINVGETITETEVVVATIAFNVNSSFTGETLIVAGKGTKNYVSVSESGSSTTTKQVTAEGCSITVISPVDKTELKAQLDAAAALNENDYTPNSWAALASAVAAGQPVYDDAYATQTDVDNAAAAIASAISALVPIGNKAALQAAVNTARIEAAKDCYTADSVNALKAAITEAQAVLNDDNAIQADIDEQTAKVNAAISNLVLSSLTVRFLNYDGSVFDTQTVQYGGSATAPATDPTKPSDDVYSYTFAGWDGVYTNVTSSVDITPIFTSAKIEYTIKFVDENDGEVATYTLNYGDAITAPEAPAKAADETYTYEFAGWSPAVTETVTGNATYKATYTPTYIDYTIKFVNEGEDYDVQTLHFGDEVTAPADPTKAEDETYTYVFAGWTPEIVNVAGDAVYTATYTPVYKDYTIKFVDENGEDVATYTLHWGDEVTAPAAPEKAPDETYTYEFAGWTPEVVNVAGDAVYVATYTNNYIDYTVTFINEGEEYDVQTLHFGDTVTIPADPTKAEDDTYTYVFAGWSPEVDVVSGNITYTATYTPVYKEYTITFLNYDGSEFATKSLHWGDEVTAPEGTPVKPADDRYTYVFSGWAPEFTAVAGDASYTAQFSETTNLYKVYFLNYDGSEFASADYAIDAIPTAPEGTPVKPNDDTYYYTFAGWTPEFAPVTGETSYTAVFDAHYLDADYALVDAAIENAAAYKEADYTSVSYARLSSAIAAVERGYTIDKQAEVNAMATAIDNAIAALVSTAAYDDAYAKCAAVNNDNNQYTVDSYNAFLAAMAEIGAKKDFNTDEATQAQVDAATAELEAAYALLQASTLQIDGAKENIGTTIVVTSSNTDALTTALVANDGGAGTASLVFYDASGAVVENTQQKIGTGCRVDLVQGDEAKLSKYIIIYGDINGDGQVSIADIRLARKMAVSTDGFTEYQIAAAKCGGTDIDVNAVIELAKAL